MANELQNQLMANESPTRSGHSMVPRSVIVVLIILLVGLATFFLLRMDGWRDGVSEPSTSFSLDLADQVTIEPNLIDYQQVGTIELPMEKLNAIASGPNDEIYVAGDKAIHIFAANGDLQDVVKLDFQPQCIAVDETDQAGVGRLFVGSVDGIKILGTSGSNVDHQILASLPLPAEDMLLTSIAVANGEIFVADAGHRLVWRISDTGELLGQIGKADASRRIPDFVIPSPYFDVAAGSEGLLYCVNPGRRQVCTFSLEGDLGGSWGQAGSAVSDFFGCCNPSHIARFSDGRFVTSEKGIPRIKVYSSTGEFESVVAGPQQLGISEQAVSDPRRDIHESVFDIAVDTQDRVLALDPQTSTVRIFAKKSR
jgi:hypothetical protein